MSDYLNAVVSFVCGCRFEDLPQAVVQRAREIFADTLVVIAVGAQEPEIRALTRRMLTSGAKGEATLLGEGVRTEPLKAAMINGTAGTRLELDEGNHFARGHPAIQVLPAALALSEEMHLSGRDLLVALVLGYEIGARIGIACKLRMSMHPHGTWGTVGAAVGVGKLLNYDTSAMRELINIAADLGLATSRRTMLEGGTVRNVYTGASGYMGLLANDLLQSGFTGELDGLRSVFGAVVSERFRPEAMTEDLGRRFEVMRNYFKGYACGRYCHSVMGPLETIAALRPGARIRPDEVVKVEITCYALAAQLSKQKVRNDFAAKFSIPFTVATFLIHGSARMESFTPEAVGNPAVTSLAERVTVSEDPRLTALWPERRVARVTVTFADGTDLSAESTVDKGDPEDPYTPEELAEKFYALAHRIWDRRSAEAIHRHAMALDELDDVRRLTDLLLKRE